MPHEHAAPVDLEQLLNFRLWKLSALSGAPVIRLCEGHYGVTRREWSILAMTARQGPLTPLEISERGSLDRTRVSRTIAALVNKGLLERTSSSTGGRTTRVHISQAGLALHQAIHPLVTEINAQVLSVLSPEARQTFNECLALLTEQARDVNSRYAVDVRAQRHKGGTRAMWADGGEP